MTTVNENIEGGFLVPASDAQIERYNDNIRRMRAAQAATAVAVKAEDVPVILAEETDLTS